MTTAGQNEPLPSLDALAISEQPAFLWRPRDASIIWANPAGCELWGAENVAELAGRRFDRAMPAVARLQRLALVLADGAADQQELIFWRAAGSEPLLCACRKHVPPSGDTTLLLQVLEPPGLTTRTPSAATADHSLLNGHAPPSPSAPLASGRVPVYLPPPLEPEDAATLSEIARIIRRQGDIGETQPQPPNALVDPKRPAVPQIGELATGQPEFLGRLSHELRTPLNAIIGYGELLQAQQAGPLGSPKYLAYASGILEAARHSLDLVNDLFGMTRLAASDQGLEFSEVDVNEQARVCLGIISPIAGEADVTLHQDLDPALPRAILDRRRLRQILINLMVNAVKFTPAGGVVTITSHYDVGIGLKIAVADSGAGMNRSGLEAARGRANGAASEISGLGLPISRSLASAMGGTLEMESEPAKGTRASLFLPMSRLLVR